jgi:hypothetical protein
MAIALVTSGNVSGSGNTLSVTGVTAAAGSVLAITVLGVNTGNNAVGVSGASGGAGNTYNIPAGAVAGSYFTSQNQYATVATIWCQITTALSSATVTVTFTGSPGFTEATWASYSGISAGAGTVAATSTPFLTSAGTAASPTVAAGATNLVIAVCSVNGSAASVSNSYALLTDDFSAWVGTTSAGNTSTTFTLSGTPPIWATTIVAIGPTGIAGTASMSGGGTLTAAATVTFPGSATLTGTGTLTAGAVVTLEGAAALTGGGTLAAGAAVQVPGAAAMSGGGTLTAAATTGIPGTAALSGGGTLTAAGTVSASGAAALSGGGTMTAGATVTFRPAAALSGGGTLTAASSGPSIIQGAASLSGGGNLYAGADPAPARFGPPTLPVFPAGYQSRQADFTGWWYDNAGFFQNKVVFRARETVTATTLPNAVVEAIGFDTIDEDPFSGWNSGTLSWGPPAGYSGWYQVCITLWTQAVTSGAAIRVSLGGAFATDLATNQGPTGHGAGVEGQFTVYLIGGQDTIKGLAELLNASASVNTSIAAGQQSSIDIMWLAS